MNSKQQAAGGGDGTSNGCPITAFRPRSLLFAVRGFLFARCDSTKETYYEKVSHFNNHCDFLSHSA